jgi:hypothetical protein
MNRPEIATRYPFLCPQCGCPTHGATTTSGWTSTFCEDCVGDRDIEDAAVLTE